MNDELVFDGREEEVFATLFSERGGNVAEKRPKSTSHSSEDQISHRKEQLASCCSSKSVAMLEIANRVRRKDGSSERLTSRSTSG